jgi:hypothetical protein
MDAAFWTSNRGLLSFLGLCPLNTQGLFFYSRRAMLFPLERKFDFVVSGERVATQRLSWGLGSGSHSSTTALEMA